MTNSIELMKLAELVEQATGPDRALNRQIYARAVGCLHEKCDVIINEGDEDDDEDFPTFSHKCVVCGEYSQGGVAVPEFTASLDSAMTLVPEGWEPLIDGVNGKGERNAAWIVELYCGASPIKHGSARTAALALCAAALRTVRS